MTRSSCCFRRRRLYALTPVSALAAIIAIAPQSAFGVTLEEALAAAQRNNPTVNEARLAVRAAREDRVQARAAYMPSLDVSASYGARELDHPDPGAQTRTEGSTATARLRQPLYTGGRRGAQMRLARASFEDAKQGLRLTDQQILLAAVEAYVSVRRDTEIQRLRERYVAGLERYRAGVQRRMEEGDVTRTDLAQAESRLAGARASLATARAELETARAHFVEVIGRSDDTLEPPPAPANMPTSLEEAAASAQSSHPTLLRAHEAEHAAQARVGVERSAQRPQLSAFARADRSENGGLVDDRRDGVSVGFEVTVPLFDGGLARSRTRQARINVERAKATSEARRRELVADVAEAWAELQASRDVIAAAREQVAAAQMALNGAQREQGLGLRATIDVLDAEREWQEALIAQARAEAEATFGAYALVAAAGGLTMEAVGDATP